MAISVADEGAPQLAVWEGHWEFLPDLCPCDPHFVDWLDAEGMRDAAIFHFGTGAHHHVGLECAKPERRNNVLAITASPSEHGAFVDLATRRPELLRHYSVLFGDIYLLNEALLPDLDVATLFHLGEYRTEANDAYDAMTELEVVGILARRLKPGGRMLFYTGSYGWERDWGGARSIVAEWERGGGFERVGEHRSLLVYRKAP